MMLTMIMAMVPTMTMAMVPTMTLTMAMAPTMALTMAMAMTMTMAMVMALMTKGERSQLARKKTAMKLAGVQDYHQLQCGSKMTAGSKVNLEDAKR